MVLYEYMKSLGNDVDNLLTIRMCQLKYIRRFITGLFIKPMKDIMYYFLKQDSCTYNWEFF